MQSQRCSHDITHKRSNGRVCCEFCGISFDHIHRKGSTPKEFEMIEEKSLQSQNWEEQFEKRLREILKLGTTNVTEERFCLLKKELVALAKERGIIL